MSFASSSDQVPLSVSGQVLINELLHSRRPTPPPPHTGVISHDHDPEVMEQMIQGLKILLHSIRRLGRYYALAREYLFEFYCLIIPCASFLSLLPSLPFNPSSTYGNAIPSCGAACPSSSNCLHAYGACFGS